MTEWLENQLFNHKAKTIRGHEWSSILEQISNVRIQKTTGSSHFEIFYNQEMIGRYFYKKGDYNYSVKLYLQDIMIAIARRVGYEAPWLKTSRSIP